MTVSDWLPTYFPRISNVSKLLQVFASGSLFAIFSTSRSAATSPNRSSTRTCKGTNQQMKEARKMKPKFSLPKKAWKVREVCEHLMGVN